MREPAHTRDAYRHFETIQTRWMDNDAYAHVNNVVYYSFFDSAVNKMLIEGGALDVATSPAIGLVVETQCRYFQSVAFPDTVHVGVRVSSLGNRSIRYELAVFRNDGQTAAAQGHFVHVYVARGTTTAVPVPDAVRRVVEPLLIPATR